MADYFVNSAATGLNDGTNWTDAYTDFASAVSVAASGDRIIIAQSHSQVLSANTTYAFASSTSVFNPVIIISSTVGTGTEVNYSAATSSQLNAGGGAYDITFTGDYAMYGMWVTSGDDLFLINAANSGAIHYECTLEVSAFTTAAIMELAGTTITSAEYFSCTFLYQGSSWPVTEYLFTVAVRSNLVLRDCTLSLPSSPSTGANDFLFDIDGDGVFTARGCDFSAFGTGAIFETPSIGGSISFENCVYSSQTIFTNTDNPSNPATVYSSTVSGSDNEICDKEILTFGGSIYCDKAIYLNANDGVSSFSDRVETLAENQNLYSPFKYKLCDLVLDASTAKTISVEIAQDGTTDLLSNAEIWIDIEYQDELTTQSLIESGRVSPITGTPTDHPASTESWVGLSGTNSKQTISVTTSETGKYGVASVWVYAAIQSTTIYIDPAVVVT